MEKPFTVTASYSFWRHPIQWLKEYKQRRLMEKLIAFKWENGMRETVEEQVKNHLIYGCQKDCPIHPLNQ